MTTPDPQTVREITREHIRSGIADIGTTIVKYFGNGALGDEEYGDWYHAMVQAWRIELRAASWPDEQQLDGAVGRVEAYLDAHRPDKERKSADVIATLPNPEGPGWRHLSGVDLRAALAEHKALATRVAELEGEREADARAVAAVLELGNVSFHGAWLTDWDDARGELEARFADRIAALAAIETEES